MRLTLRIPKTAQMWFTVANARGFAVATAVGVRGDYAAAQLRALAKRSEDANQTRRLLALAAIYDGGSRSEAAKIGGVGCRLCGTGCWLSMSRVRPV